MTEPSVLMAIPELSQRLGVDSSTTQRWLTAGHLPGVKVGVRWVINRDRMERFLAGEEDVAGRLRNEPSEPHTTASIPDAVDDRQAAFVWLRGLRAALDLLLNDKGETA